MEPWRKWAGASMHVGMPIHDSREVEKISVREYESDFVVLE